MNKKANKRNKRNHKRNHYSNDPNKVGLIGELDKSIASGFIEAYRKTENPNAKLSTMVEGDICKDCVCNFIKKNHLSMLFIDERVTFGGFCLCEAQDVLGFISKVLDCTIYIVRDTSND